MARKKTNDPKPTAAAETGGAQTAAIRRADPKGARIVTPGAPRPAAPRETPAPRKEAPREAPGTETAAPAAAPDATPSSVPSVAPKPAAARDPAPRETARDAAPAPAVVQKGPGFLPLLLGGLLAGGIGFLIATYLVPRPEPVAPDTARLEALEAEIAALQSAPVAETPAGEPVDLSGLEATQADLAARTEDLQARLDELAAAPAEEAPEGPDAAALVAEATEGLETRLGTLETDLATLRDDLSPRISALEESVAESNSLAQSIEDEAEAMARDAARNQVRQALESGAPYAEQLEILGGDAPEGLAASAGSGVAPQAALVSAFPELSREALRAAREADPSTGVGSLFQNALNPRSLAPRDGDDPDAVLSRAEAAVREGNLDAAIAELDALPEAARDVLASWTERANARAAALSAADDYLQDG